MEFKQNALIKTVYDELIPSEHYTLTFTMYESQVKLQNKFIDNVPFKINFGVLRNQELMWVLILQRF
jgi:hypothetical protein